MGWDSDTDKHYKEYEEATKRLKELLRKLDINIQNTYYKICDLEGLNDNQEMSIKAGIYGEVVDAFYLKAQYICNQIRNRYKELNELRTEVADRIEQSERERVFYYGKQQEENVEDDK